MWKLVTKEFNRFMGKKHITDGKMLEVANEVESGLIGERLGGGVYSIRFARLNEGRNRGYRSAYIRRPADRIIFLLGFVRRDKNRFDDIERDALRDLARHFLSFNKDEIQKAIRTKILRVIEN